MRKIAYICLSLFLLAACDNTEEILQLNPTEMEVRVLDASGNTVSNAEVKIYRNFRDWKTLSREVDTQFTDANGIAYFTDLLPVNYFYFVSFERGGRIFTNQYVNLDFGDVDGSNYELADFLTDNAITRVTVNAIYERLRTSEISEIIISDVNLFLKESFDSDPPEENELILSLGTLLDYDPFLDDLDEALFDDLTFYDQIELNDLTKKDIGTQEYFENFVETIVTPEEFTSSVFVFYEFDEETFLSSQYTYMYPDISFSGDDVVPYTFVLDDLIYGNDIYTVEVILDYQ